MPNDETIEEQTKTTDEIEQSDVETKAEQTVHKEKTKSDIKIKQLDPKTSATKVPSTVIQKTKTKESEIIITDSENETTESCLSLMGK